MEGSKGVLSFFSSAAFFARDAFQNNVRFGIGILESFKYCFFTLFKGPGNVILYWNYKIVQLVSLKNQAMLK